MPPIWLISIIARTGIAARFQRSAAWVASVVVFMAVIGLLFLAFQSWLHGREDRAVAFDRIDATAEATNRVLQADREATANEMIRTEVIANNNEELRNEARKGDASSVGPGVGSLLDRMRQQQAAGRR